MYNDMHSKVLAVMALTSNTQVNAAQDYNGVEIDRQGYESLEYVVQTGTILNGGNGISAGAPAA